MAMDAFLIGLEANSRAPAQDMVVLGFLRIVFSHDVLDAHAVRLCTCSYSVKNPDVDRRFHRICEATFGVLDRGVFSHDVLNQKLGSVEGLLWVWFQVFLPEINCSDAPRDKCSGPFCFKLHLGKRSVTTPTATCWTEVDRHPMETLTDSLCNLLVRLTPEMYLLLRNQGTRSLNHQSLTGSGFLVWLLALGTGVGQFMGILAHPDHGSIGRIGRPERAPNGTVAAARGGEKVDGGIIISMQRGAQHMSHGGDGAERDELGGCSYHARYHVRPVRPGCSVLSGVGLMARLVFTSAFLSPAVGISNTGIGAHCSRVPSVVNISVKPSSHIHTPSCKGQQRNTQQSLSLRQNTIISTYLEI
ncbi:hypothetical protein DNTS_013961 [Danionella cerebrum]|uniref:Uncharacterized protein n=1 Tax=Danionella cerebrum TaxID=2873325 RepID=A0A553MUJ8_9TELE|nr:hypothetical protein DNTS_013961 [Danionella translucida]